MSDAHSHPRVISGLGPPAPTRPDAGSPAVLRLDQRTYDRALDCVHCGLCLPVCPTYTTNGLEADSPRGRIYLMKGLADGKIGPTDSVLQHLDLCLDCRACETACPSGVVYHELIEESRTRLAPQQSPTPGDRLLQSVFFNIFPHPARLKVALLAPRLLQKARLWKVITRIPLPAKFEKMQQMLPPRGPLWERALAQRYPAIGKRKATVGFFGGCVGSVLFQDVNRQTIDLLRHAGCDVIVPRSQTCCGAIHHHGGKAREAEDFARRNIDAFLGQPDDSGKLPELPSDQRVDMIVTNIAGCGAMLKDYDHLLRDDRRYAPAAARFVERMRDASEALVALGLPALTKPLHLTVTYHDACHLAHAQQVTDPPRQMLAAIPGLKVIPLPESDMCCGAAGTYNLSQPAMARDLAERKIRNIQATGAKVCVMANVGCAMQIQSEADRLGADLRVVHPVSLLHQACFPDGSNGAAGPTGDRRRS